MTETIEKTAQAVEEVTEEIEEVKPYTFRELKADDIFLMFPIISKIGINEFKAAFEGDTVKQLAEAFTGGDKEQRDAALISGGLSITLEIAGTVLGNIPKCKNDIYMLLANVSGLKVSDISEMDLAIFAEMVIDFVKKPEFAGFIKAVLRSFK